MPSPQLSAAEKTNIAKSIQQFLLGEGSKGRRLLARGKRYARQANDPFFSTALELFIKEEQQYSAYLAAFMQSQGIPRASRHWVDTVFRKLRGLAELELSLTVLVTAEIIAMPYYRALSDATGSPTLKTICRRILEDEAAHLRFQASMLGRVGSRYSPTAQRAVGKIHREFLRGTLALVWIEHRGVFVAAGYDFRRLRDDALFEFTEWQNARQKIAAAYRTQRASGTKLQVVPPLRVE